MLYHPSRYPQKCFDSYKLLRRSLHVLEMRFNSFSIVACGFVASAQAGLLDDRAALAHNTCTQGNCYRAVSPLDMPLLEQS